MNNAMGSPLNQHIATLLAAPPIQREPLSAFVTFMADSVKIDHRLDQGTLHLEYDPQTHPRWSKPHHISLAVAEPALSRPARQDLSPLACSRWLWERASQAGSLVMARPATQPEAVHELTERLFAHYKLEGGSVHLAGCHLVDVPLLRITTIAADDPQYVEHRLVTLEGEEVPVELREVLGLDQLAPLQGPIAISAEQPLAATADEWLQSLESHGGIGLTVVVAKRAEGKLQFDFGPSSATVDFADWATTLQAPPFGCPLTGLSTYQLSTTDDGRIAAAEGIATCQVSGKRMLATEMVTCSVTGKQLDPDLALKCPVSGTPALASEFATCSLCRQEVSRGVLEATLCRACRSLSKASRDDQAVTEAIGQAPQLARYRRFRSATTDEVTIVEGVGLWKSLLVVVGRSDGKLRQVALRTPASPWRHVPPSEWATAVGN